jgi:hypothetical protein
VQHNYFGDSHAQVTTNIGTFVLGMSLLPLARAARDPRPVFTAVDVDAFTGREWLSDRLGGFFARHPCGYMFIEAEAGLGKTAFAAWLVKTRGYLSHFSRYSEGSSEPVALANLSAQLILTFGLDDQAPGGMLPKWAQTPGGFESLLSVAADRARARGQSIVLVVDGLDEADAPAPGGFPFGLPSLLPDGVYVVATYRTGWVPRRPDAPCATVRIAKEDQRNHLDISAYLAKAVHEDILRDRLAEAGMDAAAFTGVLASRCDGVWIYLRYVLNEVRSGLRRPDEMGNLPSGLRNYYADQVRRWRQDQAWHTSLLPLLATLSVAGEALPAESLARLAGNIDPADVRRLCDLTLRPMLTTTWEADTTAPIRYEIYHASFREFLNQGRNDAPAALDDQQPYDLLVLAGELRQAVTSAHNRICDIYLTCFGGLDDGLPVLAENLSAASADGGYSLRFLARHLYDADRVADLHTLLAAEYPDPDGKPVNTWFAAHDHADSVLSYLDDLARARADAATTTNQCIARGQVAPSVGMEVRYALIAASIASYTANISAGLLGQLVRTGMWSPHRGLAFARSIVNPGARFEALLAVSSTVNGEEQPAVLAQALAAAAAIPEDVSRAAALTKLVGYLPAPQRAAALAQALIVATAIDNDYNRVQALTGLIPYVPADQRPAVLAQALTDAATISASPGGARSLARLASYLPPDEQSAVLAQALTDAAAIDHEYERAAALAWVIPYLPSDQRPAVVTRALTDVAAVDKYNRGAALTRLAPYLPADQLAEVLTAVSAIPAGHARAEVLTELVPHLPADLLPQALAAVGVIGDDYRLVSVLTELLPHLPADQRPPVLDLALASATVILSDSDRASALTGLVPHLPADQRPAVLAGALAAATAIGDGYYLVAALTGLVPHLPADQWPAVLAGALAAATAISDYQYRAWALGRLAPYLSADLLAQALADAVAIPDDSSRADALVGLAPYLPADLMARALAVATDIADSYKRADALVRLALYLPADLMAQAVTASGILNDYVDSDALFRLVPYLSTDLLVQAFTAATAITSDYNRSRVLTRLAPYLPADLLAQALADAVAIPDESDRAHALAGLAPYLSGQQLAQALTETAAIAFGETHAWALTRLAPHLPTDLLTRALTDAASMGYGRAEALIGLAPHLPVDRMAEVLAAATSIRSDSGRAEALVGLAPYLPADDIPEAFAAAAAIGNDSDRALALAGLSLHLPANQQSAVLAQALTDVVAIRSGSGRALALMKLAPYLPANLMARALEATPRTSPDTLIALLQRSRSLFTRADDAAYISLLRESIDGTNRRVCFELLRVVAAAIAEIGGTGAIEHCVHAISDVHRWWP